MYRLEIQHVFSAAHAITIAGVREPLHGHDWHVTLTLEGAELDADGLLVDFHVAAQSLRAVCGRFHNRSLNETAPFDRVNPTAERVAEHLADEMRKALDSGRTSEKNGDSVEDVGGLGRTRVRARVRSVRVTEAVGCAATRVLKD
ncbi:hypothetical protein BH11PLA1_BH11PLA1_21970 [soil metagenome]